MKGPLVYCLEEKENGRFLSEIFVEENTSIEENAPAEELVGNVPTLSYKGIRVRNKGADGENQLYGSVELEKKKFLCGPFRIVCGTTGDRGKCLYGTSCGYDSITD